MKTLALIIACLIGTLAAPAIAAGPVDTLDGVLAKAEAKAEQTQAELDKAKATRDSYGRLLVTAADISAEKDKTIADRDAQITALNTTIENGQKARVGLISAGVGVPGGLLTAAGIGSIVLGTVGVGLKLIGAGSLLVTEGITIAIYAAAIGAVGVGLLIALGALVLLGAALWIANDVKNHKDAGIENGNLIPLARATGKYTVEQIALLEQLAYTEGGKLADRLRAAAEGVSVRDLASRFKNAVGISKPHA